MADVTLTIDGRETKVPAGVTILAAARGLGIAVPTLCHLDGLIPTAACRVCVVEVKGMKGLVPSCRTPVAQGMEVRTDTAEIRKARRLVVELLYSQGTHVCAACSASGNCELQDAAVAVGVDHSRFSKDEVYSDVDLSHPQFGVDRSRCITCMRCVRVCAEIEGAHVWDVAMRGHFSRIVCGMDQPWGEVTACTSCGKCVDSCPTGALFRKGWVQGDKKRQTIRLEELAKTRVRETA